MIKILPKHRHLKRVLKSASKRRINAFARAKILFHYLKRASITAKQYFIHWTDSNNEYTGI